MAKIYFVFLILWSLVFVLDCQTLSGPTHGKFVVCYVATWATYRTGGGKFDLEDLDPSLCTHLIYSFAGLNETTYSIKPLDAWQDLEKDYGKAGYKRIVSLKERYPHLKVTIAIGGWNEGSAKYSKMAASPESREMFIKSVMHFLDLYKFDGLDLDWEYPARRGGSPEDKANYVSLVKELKEAFEPQKYILSAALGAGKDTMEASYDLIKLSRYLDFIHMMCYDYHGTWDRVVGANAPLRSSAEQDVLTVEYTIKYMLSHGVSSYKMILGLPMYGRNFILTNPEVKDIEFGRTPAKETGFPGPWTKENGFMGYNEICMELTNKSSNWVHHWHNQSATPYLRDGERVITYDNPRSIANKVKLAIDYDLGGLMVWSIDTDDFKGNCDHEPDTYIDFLERYNKILDDPVFKEAVKILSQPTGQRVTPLSKRSFYTIQDNKLHLRLPEPKISNYPLMTTINDATALASEERRIKEEIDRVTKENEIGTNKPNSGTSNRVNILLICLCLSIYYAFGFSVSCTDRVWIQNTISDSWIRR